MNTLTLKTITAISLLIFALTSPVHAGDVPKDLFKGILGEGANQGEKGLYAVTCVYKNRLDKGMSLGCVAMNRKDLDEFVAKQPQRLREYARWIVGEVFNGKVKDITGGATHYENVERFGEPYWAKDMIITVKVGCHTFYREVE